MPTRENCTRLARLAACTLLCAAAAPAQEGARGSSPRVAVLWFADETGAAESAHWRYALRALVANRLACALKHANP